MKYRYAHPQEAAPTDGRPHYFAVYKRLRQVGSSGWEGSFGRFAVLTSYTARMGQVSKVCITGVVKCFRKHNLSRLGSRSYQVISDDSHSFDVLIVLVCRNSSSKTTLRRRLDPM